MILTIVGIAFAVGILAVIIGMLLARRLREKYAALWLVVGLAMLILTIFPNLLFGLSDFLGVAIPSNLLFILALALLIGVTLHQSWELSTAEDETRRVAEDVAILRAEVNRLRADSAATESSPEEGAP